jgi:2,4-dienoyl-CoA reductase-like NADH-dependent reductase (Old Yellow Enzyme family)
MTAHLFDPLQLGPLQLDNRIVIAPMCQYSAVDGTPGDWHLIHLGHLALSGAGLMILEATAVSPEGRITAGDLGLYDDANEAGLARVLAAIRSQSPIALAMQIAHAGRKGSSRAPWDGGAQVRPGEPTGWKTVAPSAVPHADGEDPPAALDDAGLARIRTDFVNTARRAARLGLDGLEIHAATATCCTSSCRRSRTSGPTATAAASRTGCDFRSRSSTRCGPPFQRSGRSGCASRQPTGCRTPGTSTARSRCRRR